MLRFFVFANQRGSKNVPVELDTHTCVHVIWCARSVVRIPWASMSIGNVNHTGISSPPWAVVHLPNLKRSRSKDWKTERLRCCEAACNEQRSAKTGNMQWAVTYAGLWGRGGKCFAARRQPRGYWRRASAKQIMAFPLTPQFEFFAFYFYSSQVVGGPGPSPVGTCHSATAWRGLGSQQFGPDRLIVGITVSSFR